jgi:hypothetical protein
MNWRLRRRDPVLRLAMQRVRLEVYMIYVSSYSYSYREYNTDQMRVQAQYLG